MRSTAAWSCIQGFCLQGTDQCPVCQQSEHSNCEYKDLILLLITIIVSVRLQCAGLHVGENTFG